MLNDIFNYLMFVYFIFLVIAIISLIVNIFEFIGDGTIYIYDKI